MADDKQITIKISASNLTATEFAKAREELAGLGEAMRTASDPADSLTAKTIGLASAVGTFGASIAKDVLADFVDLLAKAALALPEIALKGAGVADVEENFKHLTAEAGRLSATLLGTLRSGTHNTIDDFALMQTANQDLAAGMNLTDEQFGTLAKGAFALAQATGTDVKTALDTMNDAMLTGRTRALALLTGKINTTAAEEAYAKSLGITSQELSEAGKVEAARLAILKSVGAATERLGEQTDGLDERVAQAEAAWANFRDELGKAIATSPTLINAFTGVGDIVAEAFGRDQADRVRAIADAVDNLTLGALGFGSTLVQTAGTIGQIYNADAVILDTLYNGLLHVESAYLKVNLAAMEARAFVAPWEDWKNAIADVRSHIDETQGTIKANQAAIAEHEGAEAKWAARSQELSDRFEALRAKLVANKNATAEFVGPTLEQANAAGVAALSTQGHTSALINHEKATAAAQKELEKWKGWLDAVQGPTTAQTIKTLNLGDALQHLGVVGKTSGDSVIYTFGLMRAELDKVERSSHVASFGFLGLQDGLDKIGKAIPERALEDLEAQFMAYGPTLDEAHQDFANFGIQVEGSLKKLPDLLQNAFVGGGGLEGALKGWAVNLGVAFGEELSNAIAKNTQFNLEHPDAKHSAFSAGKGAAMGIGAIAGAGAIASGASVGESLMSVGGTAMSTGMAAGSVAIGAATMGIGAAAVGVAALVKHWMNARAEIRQAEQDVNKFQSSIVANLTPMQQVESGGVAWKGTVIAIRDAYIEQGHSEGEALQMAEKLWKSSQGGAESAKAAIQDVTDILNAQKQDQADLDAAIQKYGFSIDELGPKMQKQKLTEQAVELENDFRLLAGSGIDVGDVIDHMGASINDFIHTALRTGTEVPAEMRPMLEKMAELGDLTDDSGNKITDLNASGLTFSETMTQGFDRVVKKLDDLLVGLGMKLPAAIDKVPKDVDITFRGNYIPPENMPNGGEDVPAFANEAFVRRPTLALVGDAPGGEFVLRPDTVKGIAERAAMAAAVGKSSGHGPDVAQLATSFDALRSTVETYMRRQPTERDLARALTAALQTAA